MVCTLQYAVFSVHLDTRAPDRRAVYSVPTLGNGLLGTQLQNTHCTLYCTAHWSLHIAYFTLHTAHWTLNTAHWTLNTEYCTLNTAHFISHYTQSTAHSILHSAQCKLPTAHRTLHTAHCTLHTAHFPLPTVHCTLHTSHSAVSLVALDGGAIPLGARWRLPRALPWWRYRALGGAVRGGRHRSEH